MGAAPPAAAAATTADGDAAHNVVHQDTSELREVFLRLFDNHVSEAVERARIAARLDALKAGRNTSDVGRLWLAFARAVGVHEAPFQTAQTSVPLLLAHVGLTPSAA